MSRLTKFLLFNIFTYVAYAIIDQIFTKLNWYSDANLGKDLMIIPTQSDIWLIGVNILLSSIVAFYLLAQMSQD